MLSLKTAAASVWKKQVFASGANTTKERLKNFWGSVALVSALLLSVTYTSALSPIQSSAFPEIADTCAVFTGLSLILSLTVIVVAIIYMVEVENATTETDLVAFINSNSFIFDILAGIFSASVVLLLLAALLTMFLTYGRTQFYVVAGAAGSMSGLGAVMAAVVAGRNRFILWVRYDSPEGLEFTGRSRAKELDELKRLKGILEYKINELREIKELQELKEVQEKLPARRDPWGGA